MSTGTKVFLWIFAVVQVIFLVWIIGAGIDTAVQGEKLPSEAEQDAYEAGGAIGMAIVAIFWIAVDVMMGLGFAAWQVGKRMIGQSSQPKPVTHNPAAWSDRR